MASGLLKTAGLPSCTCHCSLTLLPNAVIPSLHFSQSYPPTLLSHRVAAILTPAKHTAFNSILPCFSCSSTQNSSRGKVSAVCLMLFPENLLNYTSPNQYCCSSTVQQCQRADMTCSKSSQEYCDL